MIARLTGSTWFRALLTLAVLAYLASTIDLGETGRALARLPAATALAVLALLAVDRGVIIWRWIVLIRATGQQVRVKSAAWIYLVSSFVGSVTPGGIGGDAARAYTLAQRTSQGSDAVASIAMDRVLGLFSLILVGMAGAIVWGRQTGQPAGALVVVAAAGAAACAALLWADRGIRLLLAEDRRRGNLGRRLTKIADAISQYRMQPRALTVVLALSIALQLLRIVQAYLLGIGIGITVPFAYYLVFMPVGLIGLLLPISIAGFGLPQGFIVGLLQTQAVGKPEALALSTLIVSSGLLANLPGAVLYLRSRRSPA